MNDMGNLATPPEVKPKKVKKRINAWKWGCLSLALILLVSATLAVFGIVRVNIFLPGGASVAGPCSSEMLTEYNELVSEGAITYGVSTIPNEETEGLYKAAQEAINAAADPTCQTIIFWISLQSNDTDKAATTLEKLNRLHDEGRFVDSNLSPYVPLSMYADILKASSPDTPVNEDGLGQ